MASQANAAAASIGKRKPEFPYLRIGLLDPGFLRPERRIPGGSGFNPNHSKVLCIHPNSTAVEEFVLGQRFDGEDIAWTCRQTLVTGQGEVVVVSIESYASLVLLGECFFFALQQFLEHPVNHQLGTLYRCDVEFFRPGRTVLYIHNHFRAFRTWEAAIFKPIDPGPLVGR